MPLHLVCGAECQIHSAGAGAAASSHWGAVGGTPDVVTSPVRSGTHAYQFLSNEYFQSNYDSSPSYAYLRWYFRVNAIPASVDCDMVDIGLDTTHMFVCLKSSTGVFGIDIDADGTLESSTLNFVPTVDTWYGIEMGIDAGAGDIYWRTHTDAGGWTAVETVAGGVSPAVITNGQLWLGQTSGAGITLTIDDIAIGYGSSLADAAWDADNPKGAKVLIYFPESDGTHSYDAAGDFKEQPLGDDLGLSATDVWSWLDTPDMEAHSDGISRSGAGVGEYLEVNMDDESTEDNPRGVMVVCAYDGDGSGIPDAIKLSDDGSNWTSPIVRDTTASVDVGYAIGVVDVPPSGGTWTTTKVNSTRLRFGLFDYAAGIEWDGLALEVEWLEGQLTYYYIAPTDDVTTTGWTTTPLWSKIDDDPGSPDATTITGTAS